MSSRVALGVIVAAIIVVVGVASVWAVQSLDDKEEFMSCVREMDAITPGSSWSSAQLSIAAARPDLDRRVHLDDERVRIGCSERGRSGSWRWYKVVVAEGRVEEVCVESCSRDRDMILCLEGERCSVAASALK